MVEPSKRDWKLFREKIGGWQEHYMEKLVKEYADYLCSDLPASTKFWGIEKRIKRDRKTSGVCIELRKSYHELVRQYPKTCQIFLTQYKHLAFSCLS